MFSRIRFGEGSMACLLALPAAGWVASAQTADRASPEAAPPPVRVQHSVFVPLSQKERLHYYFSRTFNGESVLRAAAASGINQAMNTPAEWGQGAAGYGRRVASSYAGHIVQSTVLYGTSTALHEDNRYFQSGLTGVKARLKYALLSTILARHDDGTRHFSISAVSSYAAAAAISRAWQPTSTQGADHAVNAFGVALAAEAGFNVAREFLPSILKTRPPVESRQSGGH